MSLFGRLLPYVIVLAIVTMVPDVSLASQGLISFPFDVKAETEPATVTAGPADLVLTITARTACDNISLTVTQTDNMSYTGPTTMQATVGPTLTAAFRVPVVIAADDTCGLEFQIAGGSLSQTAKAYWVSSGGAAAFYEGNPRLTPTPVEGRNPIGEMPEELRLKWEEQHPKPEIVISYFDAAGNPISEEEALKAKEIPQPTPLGKAAKPLTDAEKMHALEQEPLTKSDREVFVLDGEAWSRDRGEKEFHRQKAMSAADIRRRTDSLRAEYTATDHDVTLDLRDTALYKIAQSMVGKLTPMDTPGYYRTTASGALLKQLRSHGIYDAPYPQLPRDRTTPRKCGEIDSLTQPDE